MSDVDIRKCDGPDCNYQAERDKPSRLADIGYFDFIELHDYNNRSYHFHIFNCLANFVDKERGTKK